MCTIYLFTFFRPVPRLSICWNSICLVFFFLAASFSLSCVYGMLLSKAIYSSDIHFCTRCKVRKRRNETIFWQTERYSPILWILSGLLIFRRFSFALVSCYSVVHTHEYKRRHARTYQYTNVPFLSIQKSNQVVQQRLDDVYGKRTSKFTYT